ncbi:MAG: fumarate hydratase [Methanomassiliicoccus sp.]|nr:fumarate hydratase [Methanomassiliicoccus sp.]
MDLESVVEGAVVSMLREAVTTLPADVEAALRAAERKETSDIARVQLRTILNNVEEARQRSVPLCQDTGVPVFFVSGAMFPGLENGIRRGLARATAEIPLRPNAVHPLTRRNPGDNLGSGSPRIVYHPTGDMHTDITVMPKGAGSENMSALAMLTPAQGLKGVKAFVLDTVVRAGGRPCPPTIVGVGIGGTADQAAELAKEALLRPLDVANKDAQLDALERELTGALNDMGVGPMGLGGRTTVLGVRCGMAFCHTASLPVAVNLQCWAARRTSMRVFPDGRTERMP